LKAIGGRWRWNLRNLAVCDSVSYANQKSSKRDNTWRACPNRLDIFVNGWRSLPESAGSRNFGSGHDSFHDVFAPPFRRSSQGGGERLRGRRNIIHLVLILSAGRSF
jgi:hypothetical protein